MQTAARAARLPQFAIGESRMLCSICFLLCSLDFRFAHPAAGGAHLRPEQDIAQGQKNRCNDAFTFGISIIPGRFGAKNQDTGYRSAMPGIPDASGKSTVIIWFSYSLYHVSYFIRFHIRMLLSLQQSFRIIAQSSEAQPQGR